MRPSRVRLAEVIVSRINKGESLSHLSRELAAYLLNAGRTKELSSIMRDVMALRAESGNVEATLSVAHELKSSIKDDIKQLVKSIKPEAKKIIIDQKLDESLIGGFKLSVIDKSLDQSVRSKLNRLKALTSEGGA
jgi:F0F1-type ATP synthase delta subunit